MKSDEKIIQSNQQLQIVLSRSYQMIFWVIARCKQVKESNKSVKDRA